MKTIHLAIATLVGIVLALWWAVMPPRFAPPQGGSVAEQRLLQCPANSYLKGKLCVCGAGTRWTGAACTR